MLAMSDTPIAQFIPYFAKASVPVAFLVPTPTGYEKSIMGMRPPLFANFSSMLRFTTMKLRNKVRVIKF